MGNPSWLGNVLRFLLVAIAVILVWIGIGTIQEWRNLPVSAQSNNANTPHTDSTVTRKLTNDTANKKTSSTAETTIYRTTKMEECAICNVTLRDNMLKKGYDFVVLGLVLLLAIFVLPSVSTINILSLFSATFRETVDAGKAIVNDAANTTNTNLPVTTPKTNLVAVSDVQKENIRSFLPSAEHTATSIIKYAIDNQNGQWGKLPENNSRKITTSVVPLPGNKALFKIIARVISTDINKPIRNKVIFHLQQDFPNKDPEIYVINGEAKLELIAWGAFTIGAEADEKATKLELDLSQLPDAPLLFAVR
jgi:hypothetical protein